MIQYWVLRTSIIIVIIIGFILIYSLLQFLINIHPPRFYSHNTPKDYNIDYESVSFVTSDKIKIRGWLITSNKTNETVIIGHGYPFDKGNIFPVAKFLYPEYNLLFYDHRYFGESEGKITTVGYKEVEDVKAAVDFIHQKFGEQKPIALYGFSLSASAMLMSKTKVNAIIADSPYADLEKMIEHVYFIFGPLKFPFVLTTTIFSKLFLNIDPKEVSPKKAVKNLNTPVLIIHGEIDSQIPVENSYIIKTNNSNIELWIVKDADHGQSFAKNPEEYKNRIKLFLKRHMK